MVQSWSRRWSKQILTMPLKTSVQSWKMSVPCTYHWPKQATKPSPEPLGQGSRLSLESKEGRIRSEE